MDRKGKLANNNSVNSNCTNDQRKLKELQKKYNSALQKYKQLRHKYKELLNKLDGIYSNFVPFNKDYAEHTSISCVMMSSLTN